jgi:protein arginine kinase activator
MKCDKCKKREATIHLSQTRNSVTSEHHFCDTCAREQDIGMNLPGYFGNLYSSGMLGGGSIFDTTGGIPAFGTSVSKDTVCPSCGHSFEDFRRSGLFGCGHCYEAFADRLDPLMRRVQGSTCHVGRKVCQTADQQEQNLLRAKLADLKKTLQQAVQEEAYEKAARLRDEVHALESRICSDDSKPASSSKKGGAAK